MVDTMPLNRTSTERKSRPSQEQEESAPDLHKVGLDPAEIETVEPGRPHQAFVESEADRYWRDIAKSGCLSKPTRAEIRAAAMTILCRAQRNWAGPKVNPVLNQALMAVNVIYLHATERGWIKPPFSRLAAMPNYVEALIRLADDAKWLAREVPLPDHPLPHHPPIYYTIDPETDRPVPRADSLIRADYVYTVGGRRVTRDEFIKPQNNRLRLIPYTSTLLSLKWGAYYTLHFGSGDDPEIMIHWMKEEDHYLIQSQTELNSMIFSPYMPPLPGRCVIL